MHKSRIALLTLAAAGSLALSACSSNGSSSSGGTASTGTAAVASSYNASAAAKVVDAALKNPTLIGITTPLTKKPPTGEFIVIVGTPTPVALLKDEAMAAAGRALGWRVVRDLRSVCPGCRVTDLDQPTSYVGTQTPSNIVSVLERNPSLNWIVYTVGDLSLGVDPALKAAGILGKVSIGGNAPDQTNLIALRNGTETA